MRSGSASLTQATTSFLGCYCGRERCHSPDLIHVAIWWLYVSYTPSPVWSVSYTSSPSTCPYSCARTFLNPIAVTSVVAVASSMTPSRYNTRTASFVVLPSCPKPASRRVGRDPNTPESRSRTLARRRAVRSCSGESRHERAILASRLVHRGTARSARV